MSEWDEKDQEPKGKNVLIAVGIFFGVWIGVHAMCMLASGGNAALSSPIGLVAGIIAAVAWYKS